MPLGLPDDGPVTKAISARFFATRATAVRARAGRRPAPPRRRA